MELEQLSGRILGHAIKVHRVLGPGLLESAYRSCFGFELARDRLRFEHEKPIPLIYEGMKLEPVFMAQVISYLKLTKCPIGLLVNFNTVLLKNGVRRLMLPDTLR